MDHKVTRLVYMGLLERQSSNFVSANNVISSYRLVKGKQYDVWIDGGLYYIVENYGRGEPLNISLQLLNLYFKPLSEIRNNKIDEILNV